MSSLPLLYRTIAPPMDIGAIYLNVMRDAARLHPIEYSTAPAAVRGRLSVPFILKYCVKQCGTAPMY